MVASWACEVTEIFAQRSTEEASFVYSDPTNPASHPIPDKDITVSVVYDTFIKILFHACVFKLFNPSF